MMGKYVGYVRGFGYGCIRLTLSRPHHYTIWMCQFMACIETLLKTSAFVHHINPIAALSSGNISH